MSSRSSFRTCKGSPWRLSQKSSRVLPRAFMGLPQECILMPLSFPQEPYRHLLYMSLPGISVQILKEVPMNLSQKYLGVYAPGTIQAFTQGSTPGFDPGVHPGEHPRIFPHSEKIPEDLRRFQRPCISLDSFNSHRWHEIAPDGPRLFHLAW